MEKKKQIKVLMLLSNLKVANGVTSYAFNYFRLMEEEKVHIDFAIYDANEREVCEKELYDGKSKLFILPKIYHILKHLKECKKILQNENYDIIHNNSLIITYPMMLCAKKYVPVRILHSHNSKMGETKFKELRNKLFLPLLKATATTYVACSEVAGKAMFGNEKFSIIPNVINTEKYIFSEEKRKAVREKMNVKDKFVIGTVGRIAPQKNPFFAMDVFAEVLKENPNAEYWWVGSGSLNEELKKYVKEQGLSDYVRLLGSRDDVNDLYQAMDCFFLPSLFEGLPVTSIEAQAYGLSCIISGSVTKELVYTDLVEFVSLKETKAEWARYIINKWKSNRKKDRCIYNEKLKVSIFTDNLEKNALSLLYLQRVNGG